MTKRVSSSTSTPQQSEHATRAPPDEPENAQRSSGGAARHAAGGTEQPRGGRRTSIPTSRTRMWSSARRPREACRRRAGGCGGHSVRAPPPFTGVMCAAAFDVIHTPLPVSFHATLIRALNLSTPHTHSATIHTSARLVAMRLVKSAHATQTQRTTPGGPDVLPRPRQDSA